MSRPQRAAAAARTQTYREASDSDDAMHDDDEAPLSSLTTSSRSTAAKATARSRGRRTEPTPQLNDEIDEEDEYGDIGDGSSAAHNERRNNRLSFEAPGKEEVVVLDEEEDEDEEDEREVRLPQHRSAQRRSKPQHRPRRPSSRSPPSRQSRSDPLQEEVEDEEADEGEEEFEHERALLPQRSARKTTSRSSPSSPPRSERVLSSGIELRRRRPNVDYVKTKIDRQSFYTPDAWKKADKLHNGTATPREKRGAGTDRRTKQYQDDLFEPDGEEEEEADESDDGAEADEVGEDDDDDDKDVLNFTHSQRGSRRSERTLGRKTVDYSTHALDEAIRSAQQDDWRNTRRKRMNTAAEHSNGKKRHDSEHMEDADDDIAHGAEEDGDEDKVQPMTDSDAEGYEGRRRRRRQDEDELVAQESESDEDVAFRLQAQQYINDDFIPGKLLAVRKVADSNGTTNSPTHPAATAFSSSSSSPSPTSFQYLVKWRDRAYKHSTWVDERILPYFPHHVAGMMTRLRNSYLKAGVDINAQSVYTAEHESQQEDGSTVELEDNQFYNPDFNQVHRIVSNRKQDGKYLVKWKGLGYDELTWETVADIDNDAEIARYHRYSKLPTNTLPTIPRPLPQPKVRAKVDELTFQNDRELREYQKEGVSWMCFNWMQGLRPSLLADEMGLGKTAQTIAVCRFMQQFYNMRGPFLIIAPLSTVGHWQREFETWTEMNAVVYHGTQDARDAIQKYEFHMFEHDGRARQHKSLFRFNVLIIPDSMIHREKALLCSSQHKHTSHSSAAHKR